MECESPQWLGQLPWTLAAEGSLALRLPTPTQVHEDLGTLPSPDSEQKDKKDNIKS